MLSSMIARRGDGRQDVFQSCAVVQPGQHGVHKGDIGFHPMPFLDEVLGIGCLADNGDVAFRSHRRLHAQSKERTSVRHKHPWVHVNATIGCVLAHFGAWRAEDAVRGRQWTEERMSAWTWDAEGSLRPPALAAQGTLILSPVARLPGCPVARLPGCPVAPLSIVADRYHCCQIPCAACAASAVARTVYQTQCQLSIASACFLLLNAVKIPKRPLSIEYARDPLC